jgi:hypothetical protein
MRSPPRAGALADSGDIRGLQGRALPKSSQSLLVLATMAPCSVALVAGWQKVR